MALPRCSNTDCKHYIVNHLEKGCQVPGCSCGVTRDPPKR